MSEPTVAAVLQNAAGATGNGTTFPIGGAGTVVFEVTGITTATITWEAEAGDDATPTNWFGIQATLLSSGAAAATATANGLYRSDVRGVRNVRARISAWTAGAVTVKARRVGGNY